MSGAPTAKISNNEGNDQLRYATSPPLFLDVNAKEDFFLDVMEPIYGFGFFGTDMGDATGSLTLVTTLNGGNEKRYDVPHTKVPGPGPEGADGNVVYVGIADIEGFDRVAFDFVVDNPRANDFFGFDDFSVFAPPQFLGFNRTLAPTMAPGPTTVPSPAPQGPPTTAPSPAPQPTPVPTSNAQPTPVPTSNVQTAPPTNDPDPPQTSPTNAPPVTVPDPPAMAPTTTPDLPVPNPTSPTSAPIDCLPTTVSQNQPILAILPKNMLTHRIYFLTRMAKGKGKAKAKAKAKAKGKGKGKAKAKGKAKGREKAKAKGREE